MERKDLKTMVEATDMPDDMRRIAIKTAEKLVLEKLDSEALARQLRAAFEGKHGKGWNCAVGRDLGGFVSHEPGTYIFVYIGRYMILLFRAK
ncbi:Dynein light chain LC6flagellar outer arm [Aphelenchoides avenae]|nr:Dynein light chain LC6flagellar outer arm [Aphelenchus avenae]KAH7727526.1 Dynein light chain LC6flagellar outer arm [Aphelenchus avenae]